MASSKRGKAPKPPVSPGWQGFVAICAGLSPAWGLRSLRILHRLRGMAKQDIDWEQIELDYRAGIKTLRQIAASHAISHVAIAHKAKKLGWTRDLTARIAARADEQVTAALNKTDSGKRLEAENEIVESAASALAALQIAQRRDVGKAREVVRALFDQFEQAQPGLGESVRPGRVCARLCGAGRVGAAGQAADGFAARRGGAGAAGVPHGRQGGGAAGAARFCAAAGAGGVRACQG